jgi:mannose-6-phosphate isomerase-like protein (cupin superfamily)
VIAVVAGKTEMWVAESHAVLADGQSLIVPGGRRHGFRHVGSGMLHVLAVLASPIFRAASDGSEVPLQRWLPESPIFGEHV